MYTEYWHLNEKPFENVMDSRFLYASPSQEEALERVSYAVSDKKGGAVLVGPAGCGKTTIREQLIRRIKASRTVRHPFMSIVHPMLGIEDIIRECLTQLGVQEHKSSKPQLLRQFGNRLLESAEKGEEAVLIVDDAHMMPVETLNEIKLLLNLHDYSERHLFTTVLIGESHTPSHPGLASNLVQVPGLRQILNIYVQVRPFDAAELSEYIAHRMRVAGAKGPVFAPGAVEAVYRLTKGNPREANNICDLALLIGFGERLAAVEAPLIKRVAQELAGEQ